MTIVRQGDVLLRKIRKSGKGLTAVAPVQGRVVLAYGEVTGHAHALDSALAELFEDKDGKLYLRAEAGAMLTHEEHAAIALAPGWYEVVRQREYFPSEIRRVSD